MFPTQFCLDESNPYLIFVNSDVVSICEQACIAFLCCQYPFIKLSTQCLRYKCYCPLNNYRVSTITGNVVCLSHFTKRTGPLTMYFFCKFSQFRNTITTKNNIYIVKKLIKMSFRFCFYFFRIA